MEIVGASVVFFFPLVSCLAAVLLTFLCIGGVNCNRVENTITHVHDSGTALHVLPSKVRKAIMGSSSPHAASL